MEKTHTQGGLLMTPPELAPFRELIDRAEKDTLPCGTFTLRLGGVQVVTHDIAHTIRRTLASFAACEESVRPMLLTGLVRFLEAAVCAVQEREGDVLPLPLEFR